MDVQPPGWSRVLVGAFTLAEVGLLLQACEILDAASRMLRAITRQGDTPVHG